MESASQSALLVSLCDKLHNLTVLLKNIKELKKSYGKDLMPHQINYSGTTKNYILIIKNI